METMVYIGLFAMLIGGAVVTAYTVFESTGHNQAKQILQQEGDFLIGKIEWDLSGVQTIASPPLDFSTSTQSSILQVAKYDGSSLSISLNGNDMQMQKGIELFLLNNSNVKVSNLVFTREAASGGGINPESISASFTLTATAENGMLINQNFTTTKYLRK